MIKQLEDISFCMLLLGLYMYTSLFEYMPMCGIAILYKPVFNSCITLQALADIGLILKVSVYNPGLALN